MDINNVIKDYVQCVTNNAVTLPNGGSWISALCIYYNITEPVNGSWLVAYCNYLGIPAPINGSWTIALAQFLGITQPQNASWWYAIANEQCNGIPAAPCEWGANTNTFGEETRQFSSVTPCNILPDYFWNTTDVDWNLADISWAVDLTPPGAPYWVGQTYSPGQLTPTITGTAEALSTIALVVDAQTYTGQTNSVGNWSVQITNPLTPGTAPTGTGYLVSVTATDNAGNISPASSDTIYIVELPATVELTVNMYDSYGDGWNLGFFVLEYESAPGTWTPIEYNEDPFYFASQANLEQYLANGSLTGQIFYKDNTGGTTGLSFERFEPQVLPGGIVPVTLNGFKICEGLRTWTVEGTGNFRTVSGAVGSYAGERSYDILLAGNIIASQERDGSAWTPGNVQQTFTLT